MTNNHLDASHQDRHKIICAPGSPINKLLESVKRVAVSDLPILILGPTGVGKENLARYIHAMSTNSSAPFIDINCGAIPAELFESELFGHAKGSFTGAVAKRKGFFELAGDGTLFLDEIGELPYFLQAKLLRVLETKNFRPVGSEESIPFQGRVVAATHRNLHALVKEGKFREDLFYRLAVLCLELPGLTQRKQDIPYLIEYFCSSKNRTMTFTEDAMECLKQYDWKGNIRELKNCIDRLSILTDSTVIDIATLDTFLFSTARKTDSSLTDFADAILDTPGEENKLAMVEHILISKALERCGGNKSEAARLLGVNRKVIERRTNKLSNYAHDARKTLQQADALMQLGQFAKAASILGSRINQGELVRASTDESLLCDLNYRMGVCCQRTRGWMNQDAFFTTAKQILLPKK